MQRNNKKEEQDLEQLLDTLAAEKQVRCMAQHDSVDLAQWCRCRKETARNRRQYLATSLVMLLLVSCSYQWMPTRNYHLADDVSYEGVAAVTNHMLGK